MARLFDGTNDSLTAAVDLSGLGQICVAFWLWWDAYATDNDLCFEFTADGTATGSQGFTLDPNAGDGTFTYWFSGSAGLNNHSFARLSAAAWHHYLFDLNASTAGTGVWGDGSALSLTNISTTSSGNFKSDTLNFMSRNNTTLFGAGRLAEVAIYNGNIGLAGAQQLAAGASPLLVAPHAIQHYWPLIGTASPEIEIRRGASATVNGGAAQTDHPRIYRPSRRLMPVHGSAAAPPAATKGVVGGGVGGRRMVLSA